MKIIITANEQPTGIQNIRHCPPEFDFREGLKTVFSAYKGLYIAGRVAARHKTVCDILIQGAVI